MAPTVRSATSAGQANAPTAAPAKPTGLAVGDLMLAFQESDADGTTAAMTAPAGFTAIATQAPAAGNVPACKVWSKIATATEVAASTFSFPDATGANCSVVLVAITAGTFNATTPTTTPIFTPQPSSSGTNITAPEISPGVVGALMLTAHMPDTGGVLRNFVTAPSGMTLVHESAAGTANYTRVGVYSQTLASTAATGDKTAVLSGTMDGWAAVSLLVNPLASTTYNKGGGAAVVAVGDGADVLDLHEVFDKGGGAAVVAVGDGASSVASATTYDKGGGAVALAVGDGAGELDEHATYDKAGGAAVVAVGDGAVELDEPTTYDKGGGAVLLGVGDALATLDPADTHDRDGGAAALGVGGGAAVVSSADVHDREGGAAVSAVGAGEGSVSTASFHDGDGGAAVIAVGDGAVEVSSASFIDCEGGAAVLAVGGGAVSVSGSTTHDKTGGAAVSAVGAGAAELGGSTTHDKTGGAAALCIAAGTKVVIRGGSDTGGAFVTLLHDIKVRVGDTWSSPTWAILLPGGFGVDLADGWEVKASVKRHRAEGGAEVYVWSEDEDGVTLGQVEVTLTNGTTVTTSTMKLRHAGEASEDWPIFVGRWDIEISKGVEDYTVAAGTFRTIREVTS